MRTDHLTWCLGLHPGLDSVKPPGWIVLQPPPPSPGCWTVLQPATRHPHCYSLPPGTPAATACPLAPSLLQPAPWHPCCYCLQGRDLEKEALREEVACLQDEMARLRNEMSSSAERALGARGWWLRVGLKF